MLISSRTKLFCLLGLAFLGLTGLQIQALAVDSIVGSLPYSNQWIFDEHQAFLYVTFNQNALSAREIQFGPFSSDFGTARLNSISLDYFAKLAPLAGPESASGWKNLSIWTRYSLAAGIQRGVLSSGTVGISSESETSDLATVMARVGPNLTWTGSNWVQPYLGFEVLPGFYRHTSSLSGAEAEGATLLYGPVAGLHLPILFNHRAALYGEMRRTLVLSQKDPIFGSSTDFDAGVGLLF